MNEPKVTIGLYRHFKGGYYYVTGLSKSATDEKTIMVNYFDVCHPERGSFVRPLDDFITDHEDTFVGDTSEIRYIKDRKDNVAGQGNRFERVKDLNFQLGSVSTEQLIRELQKRSDSPIHELDIDGLMSRVCCRDFVVGEFFKATENTPEGVYTFAVFEKRDEAVTYLTTHCHKRSTGVYKRTFIEV